MAEIDTTILQEIGLTPNEIAVYLGLFRTGETTSGQIVKETGIGSSRVYAALEKLIKEGLITFVVKNRVKYFRAESPEVLLSNMDDRRKKIEELVPKLERIHVERKEEEYTTVFEGLRGYKAAFTEIVDRAEPDEDILVTGANAQTYKFETLREFLARLNLKRYKKKTNLKVVLPIELRDTIGRDSESQPFTSVRYLPKWYASDIAINVMGDMSLIPIWGEKPIVVLIKNKKVAESFKQYFNILWNIAKPKNKL